MGEGKMWEVLKGGRLVLFIRLGVRARRIQKRTRMTVVVCVHLSLISLKAKRGTQTVVCLVKTAQSR
jgi:hypothetical protein